MPSFVANPHLKGTSPDVLYHFGLSTGEVDMAATFGDVRYVFCGGSGSRMRRLYEELLSSLSLSGEGNLSRSERFELYKAGPVLCVSHGMGVPSMSVMLNETIKLLHYAGVASEVVMIRVGTSGGIGIPPGSLVVSSGARNSLLQEAHIKYELGVEKKLPAQLDAALAEELVRVGRAESFPVESGLTMCTDDFYEGQGRLDGAFCDYTAEEKFAFLQRLHGEGVRNIEMESTGFAAYTQRAGIRGAIVCVTLLDRLQGDQVTRTKAELKELENRPIHLVTAFLRRRLAEANGH